jgi:hypothetical protein
MDLLFIKLNISKIVYKRKANIQKGNTVSPWLGNLLIRYLSFLENRHVPSHVFVK